MPSLSYGEMLLRLFLSVLLGGMVGYERERHNRPAGFRTHILVCVGSALVMQLSAYGFTGFQGVDPARIAAQVVTGVGFLGAGTILRQGNTIQGLTTAASLWVVAGVGLALGIGFYTGAVLTTSFILISLLILGGLEKRLRRGGRMKSLWLKAIDQPGLLGRIGSTLGEACVNINKVNLSAAEYSHMYNAAVINIDFLVKVPANLEINKLLQKLIGLDGVLEIAWEREDVCREEL